MDERHARRVMGTAVEHGRQTAVAFDAFCTDVTSLGRMLTDATQLSILTQIASSINAVTEQFIIIVNRHLGVQASKDNNDGNGFTDPDIDNPDITNPPDPENPDIE